MPARTPSRPSANCPSRNRSRRWTSEAAAEHALGRGGGSAAARIDRNRLAPRPRQPLVAGLDDMVIVLAVESLDVQGHPGRLDEGLEPFLEQLRVHLAELGLGELHLP